MLWYLVGQFDDGAIWWILLKPSSLEMSVIALQYERKYVFTVTIHILWILTIILIIFAPLSSVGEC